MRRSTAVGLLLAVAAAVGALGFGLSGGSAQGGSVSDGRQVFVQNCQVCHFAGGTQAGIGPRLAGRGLSASRIRDQVVNGGGGMPAGLVSGQKLTDVVTFVASIQRARARNLRPNAALRRALRKAHLKTVPRAQRGRVRGPLAGSPRRPTSQVKWSRFGSNEWAIATFSRPGRGTRGQPEMFRRRVRRAWSDLGASNGCLARVPAAVRAVWRVSRGTC